MEFDCEICKYNFYIKNYNVSILPDIKCPMCKTMYEVDGDYGWGFLDAWLSTVKKTKWIRVANKKPKNNSKCFFIINENYYSKHRIEEGVFKDENSTGIFEYGTTYNHGYEVDYWRQMK